jgi:beta-glucosidase
MRSFKNAPKLFGAFVGMVFLVQAQTINITGTVKDAGGAGIQAATVSLILAKKTATTEASGAYSITGTFTNSVKGAAKGLIIGRPAIVDNMLYFGVAAASENVGVEVFDLTGRRVCRLLDKNVSRGNYRLAVFHPRLSSQLYFVRVQGDGRSAVLKLSATGGAPKSAAGLCRIDNGSTPALVKSAAAVDTLVASAPSYKVASLAIDNYVGTYNFTLEKTGFGLVSPADGAMICDGRKVALSWNPLAGAARYEVWLNVFVPPHDLNYWMAGGSLLDRFTKVADVTQTSFTTESLPDRWTYKWYVVAYPASGQPSRSETRVFSVYVPTLPSQADWPDGVALLVKGGYSCRDLNKNGQVDPYEDWHNPISVRVNDLMSKMTDEEKAKQMFYCALQVADAGWQMGMMSDDDLRKVQINASKARLGIPNITAGDHTHGYHNIFPAGIGLSASRDPELAYKCGDLQRQDELVCGSRGTLGPICEVGTKILYYRIQEGLGENAEFAAALMRAEHAGYNDGPELNPRSIITTTKHFPGQGAGGEGVIVFDAVTIKYHMKPWIAAHEAGMAQVMGGYAACPFLGTTDAGKTAYLHTNIGDEVIACCDWAGADPGLGVRGWDVLGGADPSAGVAGFVEQVGMDKINKSCSRILTAKFKMGLFENPYPQAKTNNDVFAMTTAPWKAKLCEDAAKEILTLIKNNNAALPLKLKAGDKIIVAGPRKDDKDSYKEWSSWIDLQYGGKTILTGIQERAAQAGVTVYNDDAVHADAKAAIVAVGEPGYQHASDWPITQDYITADQVALLKSFHDANIPCIAVYIIPRPYVITAEQDYCNAIVLAYRPGMGIGRAIAAFLWGDIKPQGRLVWQLPKSMDQVGTDNQNNQVEKWDLPYDIGATDAQRTKLRDYIDKGINTNTIYGDSIWGDPGWQYGVGMQNW